MNRLLVSSEEIKIIAALAGLKEMMMFKGSAEHEEEPGINAIVRLINDGVIETGAKGLKPAVGIRPIVSLLKNASISIVVHSPSKNSPPFCLYSNDSHVFLTLSPHEGKNGLYRMTLQNTFEVIEELENSEVLPPMPGKEIKSKSIIQEESVRLGITEWADVSELLKYIPKEDALSVFERRNTQSLQQISRMIIYRTSFAWGMVYDRNDIVYYSKDLMVKWLEGEI